MRKHLLIIALTLTTSLSHAQIVNIPDANFKAALLANNLITKIDLNNDKEIQVSEAMVVKELYLSQKNIANLSGIEAFTALTYLDCYGNKLTTLDVSKNTALTALYCSYNQLTSLPSLPSTLTTLNCQNNILLACLPFLPNGLTTLNNSVTAITCLPNIQC